MIVKEIELHCLTLQKYVKKYADRMTNSIDPDETAPVQLSVFTQTSLFISGNTVEKLFSGKYCKLLFIFNP